MLATQTLPLRPFQTMAVTFEGLKLAGRGVRRPDRTIATADHNTPTHEFRLGVTDPISSTSTCTSFTRSPARRPSTG